jgi:hypothetical protein|tara:strand:- start:203 stop:400 length:198 start_codon:yes stop_codon:yes gene_type:complete
MDPNTTNNETALAANLTETTIKDDNDALNTMVSFLSVAQKRGAFSIDESAKLWECIKRFVQPSRT